MTRCTGSGVPAQCAGAVVAAAAAAAGARPGADGGLAMGGVGAGADGGRFWRPCGARGASVAGICPCPGTARGRCWIPAARGGDSAGTFNTSTAVAVTAAACGVPVTKQATGAASDKGGSADVLGSLGGNLKASPAASLKALGTGMGLCFLFTPGWHPGLAELAPLRRSLGIRSVPCLTFWGHWSIPPSPADQVLGVRMPPC